MNVTDFETKYRDLVAGLEALADEWEARLRGRLNAAGMVAAVPVPDLRALLASSPAEVAQVSSSWDDRINEELRRTGKATETIRAMIEANTGAASSPAEREGEAIHDEGCVERCNHCTVCGVSTPYGSRCANHPNATAPVSSGEAAEPWYAKYLPSEGCPVCRGGDVRCATCRLAPHSAPAPTLSTEGAETDG